MGRPYDRLFAHGLTRMDAERAHHEGLRAIRAATPVLTRLPTAGATPVTAMGLRFAHRLGMAAGFDKDAVAVDALGGLGFGHVEVGTVTALPQPGNPAPRLFRLVSDRAVVNRMGFNNAGAEAVASRLAARARRLGLPGRTRAGETDRPGPVVGVNVGKSRVVPETDEAAVLADHETTVRHLAPYADYLVVNVSSPNTPGLRSLQAVERLGPLLTHVRRVADDAAGTRDGRVPLLVKIAPDLADADIAAVADLAVELGLDGIVATNTTVGRERLKAHPADLEAIGAGGLSGAPLRARATEVMGLLRARVGPDLTLVGVGGITTAEDARERLAAGADLLQVWTAFVYEGPAWPRRLVRELG